MNSRQVYYVVLLLKVIVIVILILMVIVIVIVIVIVPLSLYFISQGFWLKLKERNNQDEFIFLSKMHFKS